MTSDPRTVVITGAAGGMGSAAAQVLARRHSKLLLTDRDHDRLEAVAEPLRESGADCRTLVADLTRPESIGEISHAVAEAGGLGVLVHTAAVSPSMTDWQTLITVDLVRSVELLDAVEPLIRPGSVAICFGSVAPHVGRPVPAGLDAALADVRSDQFLDRLAALDPPPNTALAYVWAKTAVLRECAARSMTWGPRGARIVSISPGLIDTPMGRVELETNEAKRPMTTVTPLRGEAAGRDPDLPGTVADIANAVAFLSSDEASFISGCDIRVDGGFVPAWRCLQGLD